MPAGHKRKPVEDDFVFTLSDAEDGPIEEEEEVAAPPPKKKARKDKAPKSKKNKKSTTEDGNESEEAEEEREGIWGRIEDDDGAMNSDFEFMVDDAGEFAEEEFEGWGFDGAKKGMAVKRVVDIDDIIRRRREKKNGQKDSVADEAEEEPENDLEVDLDDDDDEVLADDAFGMNADSEEEDAEREEEEEEEGGDDADALDDDDEPASDNDSVATPTEHPDDVSGASDDDDDQEDAEEQAKRDAFFAPEEKQSKGNKNPSSFQNMSLSRPILRGLGAVGFSKPTPIQAKTIPIALMGKDLVGGAVTGSGKTGAFIVPILERLLYRPKKIPTTRVVVLTPTRELAMQCHAVATKLAAHTDIKFTLAVGGLSLKVQEAELRLRPDVIIATPGRFIDHMRNSASFNVDTVEIMVLDEADRMLEDGFADELNEILTTIPKSRQTMLFSATMTSTVDRLIRVGLNKPVRLMVDSQKKTVTTLVQEFVRLRPGREEKRMGYLVHLCKTVYAERVIIFFRQKKDAHRARIIFGLLGLSCAELHGSMNQTQRISSVESFRDGKVSYLLATDLASRGLDIKGVDTVINYEAPQSLEIYVHRVGRTARAGRKGVAVTLAAEPDRKVVKSAVRAGKAQGAKIVSRVIPPADADKWQDQIDGMDDEIDEIMQEEKEEKQLANVEMQVKKGENIIEHEAEIKSRPKRTWFETEHDKKQAKMAGRDELNGARESMKKKGGGKLSNKDKKRLDAKAMRAEGRSWKKGKDDGAAKGKGGPKKGGQAKGKGGSSGKAKGKSERELTGYKLAPFRFFNLARGRLLPHRTQGTARRLSPRALRDRYRERLAHFRLEVLPHVKHSLQRRIYNYILRRQSKRASRSRILDLAAAAQERRRLQTGARDHASNRALKTYTAGAMPTIPGLTAAADGAVDAGERGERGYRRRKLAAMAGNLYRTGQQAVTDLRESYAQTRGRGVDEGGQESIHIPDAFPDVAISSQGAEQMVLFPSYAKRHVKKDWSRTTRNPPLPDQPEVRAEEWWRQEWERNEDEKAIVDVDVRGWIYSPQVGPMTRRNRILIGLARQLSGITAPKAEPAYEPTGSDLDAKTQHDLREEKREQERIAQEAAVIEKRGQEEKNVAYKGGYSEPQDSFNNNNMNHGATYTPRPMSRRRGSNTPDSAPSSPTLSARPSYNVNELTDAELVVANANLMARVAPFLTNPLVSMPITIFFYNNDHSQSKTIQTDDSGHFNIRAALDFIPTHVRVLANERLSAVHDVQITEPSGISLISDIDDTIKRSNISSGAREIFRNTFVRDLRDLCVEGVREWYTEMHALGVSMHYCSNSPWQLYPVLASYFKIAGLPPGSLHLKQYSGMLQGIFEPVAERKKNTLGRLVSDFPRRKFILVGDSGEADLEVYTELALANPGRILAIFIRDVTTPEMAGYFDSSFDTQRRVASLSLNDSSKPGSLRQNSAPGSIKGGGGSGSEQTSGPLMGTLIDFSEEPQAAELDQAAALAQLKKSNPGRAPTATELLAARKPPPPRPAKPAALRSNPMHGDMPPPPQPKRPAGLGVDSLQPLTTIHSEDHDAGMRNAAAPAAKEHEPIPPPLPRRRSGLKNLSPRLFGRGASNSDVDFEPLPPSAAAPPSSVGFSYYRSSSRSGNSTPSSSPTLGPQGANKKVEMWRRRLLRAHEVLETQGIALYTWRTGQDVVAEATGIVKREMARQAR